MPTDYQVLIHGPAAKVERTVREAAQFGWRAVDQARGPDGTAFALLAGAASADAANRRFFDWIVMQPIRQGIAMENATACDRSPHHARRPPSARGS